MKTNFKKLASSAAVTAALATGSMSAQAIIVGVPGEAFLVPFAVATTAANPDPLYGEMDTVVRIVVPASIGRDTVLDYTAPHTSPTNPIAGGAAELPEAAALEKGNIIHWTFMDSRSRHVLNGDIEVTADDVVVFDWKDVVEANGQLSGVTGYLVFQTLAGFNGQDANFSFFADAYFTTGVNDTGDFGNDDYWSSVNIPALPLADGADAGQTAPSLSNNVIIGGTSLNAEVSPLVSGIRTGIPDATAQWSVVDLELAKSTLQPFGLATQQVGSLLVVWNDRNAKNWASLGVDVFNNDEERCSATLRLPNELNLVWVPPISVANGGPIGGGSNIFYNTGGPSFLGQNIDGMTATQGSYSQLCSPGQQGVTPNSETQARLNGGFVKLRLPEPLAENQTAAQASAAAAFTINFNFGDTGVGSGGATNVSETVLGHDRGKFTARTAP